MKYKTALEKKYKKKLPIESLTIKDIIYFCRDALSYYVSSDNSAIHEKEILEIIKMKGKDLDIFYKDIDGNNLLTYPIYNNGFDIVNYLLENNFYNLKEYSEDKSRAVCACVTLTGDKMMNHLLTLDIHKDYYTDMAFKAYSMSGQVVPQHKMDYINKVNYFIENTDFEKIISKFLQLHDFDKYKEQCFVFLQEHPLGIEEKIKIIQNIIEPFKENGSFIKKIQPYKRQRYEFLENWIDYMTLKNNISNKKSNEKSNEKKLKI